MCILRDVTFIRIRNGTMHCELGKPPEGHPQGVLGPPEGPHGEPLGVLGPPGICSSLHGPLNGRGGLLDSFTAS